MHQCDELGADLTIDGVPYQLDSLSECKNISRLRGTKGVVFADYTNTHQRFEKAAEVGDDQEVRKWIHCLTQLSSVYGKIMVDCDLEQRLKALEARVTGV